MKNENLTKNDGLLSTTQFSWVHDPISQIMMLKSIKEIDPSNCEKYCPHLQSCGLF